MRQDTTETLAELEDARGGDPRALEKLFARNRGHMEQSVALRWDRRLEKRLDRADAVQEVWLEAIRRLPRYLESRPMPFHLWLRLLARDTVRDLLRKHVGTAGRDLRREGPLPPLQSSVELVRGLAGKGPTPSGMMSARECAERLSRALSELDPDERDVVLWRHFELLGNRDVARLLGIGEAAASKRYIRAMERLRGILVGLGVTGTDS